MKNPRKEKSEYDPLIPVSKQNLPPVSEGDCFAHEFDAQSEECAVCADNEVCAALMSKVLSKKAKVIRPEGYLDEVDMLAASDDLMEKWVRAHSGEKTVRDMIEWVSEITKCPDYVACAARVQEFKESSDNFKIRGGFVLWKG